MQYGKRDLGPRQIELRLSTMSMKRIPRRKSQRFGTGDQPTDYAIEVFYDGDCPLCKREVNVLRLMDRGNRLRLTNIAAADFDASRYDVTMDRFMEEMHGRLPNGEWVTGVEAFRHIYGALGFGWLVSATRLPGVSHLADKAYHVFAKNRLRLTGRCDDECQVQPPQNGESTGNPND